MQKRFAALDYYNDTQPFLLNLEKSKLQEIYQDEGLRSATSNCPAANYWAEKAAQASAKANDQSTTAIRAYNGALNRLRSCRDESDITEAARLTELGQAVTRASAKEASHARGLYEYTSKVIQQLPDTRRRLSQYNSALVDWQINKETVDNRAAVLAAKMADVENLAQTCRTGFRNMTEELDKLATQHPEAVAGLNNLLTRLKNDSVDSSGYHSTVKPIDIKKYKVLGRNAKDYLAKSRQEFNVCESLPSRDAVLGDANIAVLGLPDISQWNTQVAALSASCRQTLAVAEPDTDTDANANANTTDGDDDRADWEGFAEDDGNLDTERVADNGFDPDSAVEEWREDEQTHGRTQLAAGEGELIDPLYTQDTIVDAERDQEAAEAAERIAAAGYGADPDIRSGRGLEEEFGEAPDLDRLPDPNARDDRDTAQEDSPPAPSPGSESEPSAPETPPETGNSDEPEPNAQQCEQLAAAFKARVNPMKQRLQQFQSAARGSNEERAQSLGCQLLADTRKATTELHELGGVGCTIDNDLAVLSSTIDDTSSKVRRQLPRPCGTVAAQNFSGSWHSSGSCDVAFGPAKYRWIISLGQNGADVTGRIAFHKCPGGGRATYAVSGKAGTGDSVQLRGVLESSRGPLAENARGSVTFTVRKGAPPAPNLAR